MNKLAKNCTNTIFDMVSALIPGGNGLSKIKISSSADSSLTGYRNIDILDFLALIILEVSYFSNVNFLLKEFSLSRSELYKF